MKRFSTKIILGMFFILAGVCLALDLAGVSAFGLGRIWTAALLSLVFLAVLAKLVFTGRNYLPLATPLACISALIITAELTVLTFAELWPLLPIGLTLGVLIYTASAKMVKSSIIFSYLTVLFVAIEVGLIVGGWIYVLPSLCLLTGILVFLPVWKANDEVPEIPMRSIVKRAEELRMENAREDENK